MFFESTFENVPSFFFSMISVSYIAFTTSTSTEGIFPQDTRGGFVMGGK